MHGSVLIICFTGSCRINSRSST